MHTCLLRATDLAAKRAEDEKVIEKYGQQPLDDRPDIAATTAERRERMMEEWRE
jgi:hypothetical protein